ncbi:tripartite tricarboxylate transporter substrate binding protein [Paracidovorax cattleyae]|uniref:Tripartite-type tricarboxylate transporter, receptor component TctC n=1 Tax=Paracidovorax cattleyae TaxID=80868 RepID=A0A1H0WRD4_9BURK|nr:tripartite tricarboxylate transporter substrate binding protein [Paracidovorax cattleyae]AVS75810.1 tripartite tricarboxylate transporter substrate binding protein [Paracidovorax cattleyae]SDP93211.1 Tripartite-type tricarboxylate transporter, receptor component TctC [Paracidovorax cattleyae]
MPFDSSRRAFLHAGTALAAGATLPLAPARAQGTWPTKPIRIVVPYTAGGFTDQMARLLQVGLQQRLGQPIVVDNKPGANSIIGVDAVAKAAPDGHTFGVFIAAYAANTTLYPKLPYDPKKDLTGVSLMGVSPLVAAVSMNAPFKTMAELVAYGRANPGKISYASSGSGSAAHLTSELMRLVTGVEMVHVPYKGASPALADLMGGQVPLFLDPPPNLIQPARAGRIRLIGVASGKRLPALPDVPTFAELGYPGLVGSTWAAMLAPAGTPADIVQRMSGEVARIIRSPEVSQRLEQAMGTFPEGSSPQECNAFIVAETAKWAKVIQEAGVVV